MFAFLLKKSTINKVDKGKLFFTDLTEDLRYLDRMTKDSKGEYKPTTPAKRKQPKG